MKYQRYFLIVLFLNILAVPVAFANSIVDQDIDRLMPILEKGTLTQVKEGVESLAWSGITSTKLFDVAEKRLLNSYTLENDTDVQMSGWLIKALSYSGDQKYRNTLLMLTDRSVYKKVRRYAKRALIHLYQFQSWNVEIAKGLDGLDKKQLQIQRVSNMLASRDYGLLRVGAKRVYYAYSANQVLLKQVESRLMKEYLLEKKEKVFIDSLAWLCKALANSADQQYKETLEKVEKDSPNKKLRKYAKKFLKQF